MPNHFKDPTNRIPSSQCLIDLSLHALFRSGIDTPQHHLIFLSESAHLFPFGSSVVARFSHSNDMTKHFHIDGLQQQLGDRPYSDAGGRLAR